MRAITIGIVALAAALSGSIAASYQPPAPAAAWRYVVPRPGEPFDHPPLRALALSDQKPEDLKEEVTYRGKKRRYAQIRYGSPASVRVAIVVDEIGPSELDLYVDAKRGRLITPASRVLGEKLTWRLPLDVAVVDGDVLKTTPRTVVFRYGRASRTLSYATCGYIEGQALLGEKTVRVRRVDGDGNGFFADPQDRLWLDLDGNGKWDPIEHQFLFAPLLTMQGTRYVVQSDLLGQRLSFAKVEGTGTVRLSIPTLPGGGEIAEVTATLVSRDGIVATLQGQTTEAVMPVGEYRLCTLLLNLKQPATDQRWGYVFSDNGGKEPRWHKLDKNATLALDPIGKLEFVVWAGDKEKCTAGESLSIRPALYTGDGLLITTVYLGAEMPSSPFSGASGASIRLRRADGSRLAEAHSGFA